jgi:hypothetical protein
VRSGELSVTAAYESFDELASALASGPGPAGAFFLSLDDELRPAFLAAYRSRLGVGDEPFELTARAWAAAGTR